MPSFFAIIIITASLFTTVTVMTLLRDSEYKKKGGCWKNLSSQKSGCSGQQDLTSFSCFGLQYKPAFSDRLTAVSPRGTGHIGLFISGPACELLTEPKLTTVRMKLSLVRNIGDSVSVSGLPRPHPDRRSTFISGDSVVVRVC